MADESLKSKTVKGASWSLMDNLANQGITFIVGIILARMLTPEEYGLIGIILIFISVFNTIVDSGFSNALIRKNDANDIDYSTGFFTNLAFSLFLFAFLFIIAPTIAGFFKEPQLTPLLRVMGVIIIINALAIIQRTILVKKVDFKTQTWVSLISSISSGVIGVGMAYMGYGVWSLVGQLVSRQFFNTLFLWIFNHWKPQLVFSVKSFREMWSFGWKLLVSGLLSSIWNEIYQVVIGKCYSPATLGQFTRAKQFSDICSTNLTAVVQRVTFPVLSSIQDDKERLKAGYKRVVRTTMFPTFVLMLGLAACAKPFIYVIVGPQWLECVPMLQIICSYGMLYPLLALNLNILQVEGRSDLFLKLEIIKKVVAVVPLLMGIFIGVYWMLIASFFTSLFAYYLNAYYSGPLLNYPIMEQIKDILPSLMVALAMALPVYAISYIPLSCYILLPLQILAGMLIAYSVSELYKLPEYLEIKSLIATFANKILNKNK